jgi:hypothetical protein
MVRWSALADPLVPFDVKEQLYELFAKRLWPHHRATNLGSLAGARLTLSLPSCATRSGIDDFASTQLLALKVTSLPGVLDAGNS